MNINNKYYLIIIVALVIGTISLMIILNLLRERGQDNDPSVTPTEMSGPFVSPTLVELPSREVRGLGIQNIPTLQPNRGQGLDLTSSEVQASAAEINKIADKLPYARSFVSSRNINVDIAIPSLELQDYDGILLVHIMGIEYEASPESIHYGDMKQSFIEGAVDVFNWLNQNGVDTEKIIIQWGDREFIQIRSEEWITE